MASFRSTASHRWLRLRLGLLAAVALLLQVLDLVTSRRLIMEYGIAAELNPLLAAAFTAGGPGHVVVLKLSGAVMSVGTLLGLGAAGRPRLARNSLLLAIPIGAVGWLSNGGLCSVLPA